MLAGKIHFILYCLGAGWSLVTFCVAAGLVGKYGGVTGYGASDAGNASLAWSLITFIYYTVALCVLLFVSAGNILVSCIVDTAVLGFLLIFGLGSIGALSSYAGGFASLTSDNYYSSYSDSFKSVGQLGQATMGLGWILVFIILGTLVFELVYMFKNHGTAYESWRMSFHDISGGGAPVREKRSTGAVSTAPVTAQV